MARPIEPTPILRGNDAKEFLKDLSETKPSPVVFQRLERCERLYDEFRAKAARHGSRPS